LIVSHRPGYADPSITLRIYAHLLPSGQEEIVTKMEVVMKEGVFSRPHALRDIFIVALPIILLGAIGNQIGLSTMLGGAIINLGYVLAILFGGVILNRQASSWKEIGLRRPPNWVKTILLGIGAWVGALVIFILVQNLAVGVMVALGVTPTPIDESRFNSVIGNLPFLVLMVMLAWTTIAFGEELFYRAFIVSRLMDHASMGKWGAILISGTLFGIAHFAEGPIGILSNGAFGILFAWIYMRSDRNLWITLIAHGLLNTLRFILLYAGLA
jgi:membrane protease YdiL (CAAX protease family)